MNLFKKLLLFAVIFSVNLVKSENQETYVYREELKNYKKNAEHKSIFNKDTNPLLADIQKNIQNYKQVPYLSRILLFPCSSDLIISSETMPKFYSYIDNMCKKQGIKTPTVYITIYKRIYNAFAFKLFASSGGMLIDQKLLSEFSDDVIESIVAHEIGHIVHNHVNKSLAVNLGSCITSIVAINAFVNSQIKNKRLDENHSIPAIIGNYLVSYFLFHR